MTYPAIARSALSTTPATIRSSAFGKLGSSANVNRPALATNQGCALRLEARAPCGAGPEQGTSNCKLWRARGHQTNQQAQIRRPACWRIKPTEPDNVPSRPSAERHGVRKPMVTTPKRDLVTGAQSLYTEPPRGSSTPPIAGSTGHPEDFRVLSDDPDADASVLSEKATRTVGCLEKSCKPKQATTSAPGEEPGECPDMRNK